MQPGCDWESKRYDRIRQAQIAAQKHAEKHVGQQDVKQGIKESISIDELKSHIHELLPTPHFQKIHGHYCGPGNEGGKPIDNVDATCQLHDVCYMMYGRDDIECDQAFLEWVNDLDSNKLTTRQRVAKWAILKYFKHKIAQSIAKSNK